MMRGWNGNDRARRPVAAGGRRGAVAAGVLGAWMLWAGGCTPGQHARQADAAAGGAIAGKQQLALGQRQPFDITYQPFRCGGGSGGGDLLRGRPIPLGEAEPRALSLEECLEVGVRNSRGYQTRKEQLYLAALALANLRHDWSLAGGSATGEGAWARTGEGGSTREIDADATLDYARRFAQGGAMTLAAGLSSAVNFLGLRNTTFGSLVEANFTQPLWRGGWRGFAHEELYRAERDLAYSVLQYERFTQTFAVGIATAYYQVLQSLDEWNNEGENLRRLTQTLKFNQARLEGGIIRKDQVDQAEQDVLNAHARIEAARQRYRDGLDSFKLTLGLPMASSVVLEMEELEGLKEREQAGELSLPLDADGSIGKAVSDPAVDLSAGAAADAVAQVVARAAEVAMLTRPDVLVSHSALRDAGRNVEIAADAFNPRLDLVLGVSAEGLAAPRPLRLPLHRPSRSAGVNLDYPLDQTDHRDAYRAALIARDRARRDLEEFLDAVRLDVRQSYRRLVQSRRTYAIQKKAVALSIRRTSLVRLEQKEGLASTRDVLEAEDALRASKNALTAALVSYATTRLEFLATLGMLSVDERGKAHERSKPLHFDRYRPDGP